MTTHIPVTVGMLSYNDEKFIAEAIESVFSQTYPSLEFIICDDCSTDATFEIVQRITNSYTGPYKIRLFRNKKNLGTIGNFNQLYRLAEGELIIQAQADDVSLPCRVESIVEEYSRGNCSARYITSAFMRIDENGNELGVSRSYRKRIDTFWLLSTAESITGATAAVHRSVFERFGPLPESLESEDRLIPLRASLLGDIVSIDKPLLKYRRHGNNKSSNTDIYKNYAAFRDEVIGIKRMIPTTLTCFADDIGTLSRSGHPSTVDLAAVRQATEKYLTVSNYELDLIHGSNSSGFRTILKIIGLGIGTRPVIRDLFFKYLPYVVYVSRRVRAWAFAMQSTSLGERVRASTNRQGAQ